MSEELKALVEKIERNAWRMGELWEKYQGKGWPDVEGDLFTKLRDETGPALRASIAGLLAAEPAAEALAAEIKRLAEDMADAACATEAGEFVQRQRIPLHAAIDRLAALAHPAPAGWKLVPIEPTDAMEEAGSAAGDGHDWSGAKSVYAAMLSAAPNAQEPA